MLGQLCHELIVALRRVRVVVEPLERNVLVEKDVAGRRWRQYLDERRHHLTDEPEGEEIGAPDEDSEPTVEMEEQARARETKKNVNVHEWLLCKVGSRG